MVDGLARGRFARCCPSYPRSRAQTQWYVFLRFLLYLYTNKENIGPQQVTDADSFKIVATITNTGDETLEVRSQKNLVSTLAQLLFPISATRNLVDCSTLFPPRVSQSPRRAETVLHGSLASPPNTRLNTPASL